MSEDNLRFHNSDIQSNSALFEKYKHQISIPYDDFLEDFILNSEIYSIEIESQKCGFFGIDNNLLTILFIDDPYFAHGIRIFEAIKSTYKLKEAFIPITDIAALSIILENYKEIKLQALHFSDTGKPVRPPEFGKESFRLAEIADLDEIQGIGDDFLDDYGAIIDSKALYVLEGREEILGIGILVKNKIMENCYSIGVFTKENSRRLGVGRSIILHLKEIVHGLGMTPVAGCYYYNTASRRSLESAGFITKSKLLHLIL